MAGRRSATKNRVSISGALVKGIVALLVLDGSFDLKIWFKVGQ
jgi:hypothetical protein